MKITHAKLGQSGQMRGHGRCPVTICAELATTEFLPAEGSHGRAGPTGRRRRRPPCGRARFRPRWLRYGDQQRNGENSRKQRNGESSRRKCVIRRNSNAIRELQRLRPTIGLAPAEQGRQNNITSENPRLPSFQPENQTLKVANSFGEANGGGTRPGYGRRLGACGCAKPPHTALGADDGPGTSCRVMSRKPSCLKSNRMRQNLL